MSIRFPCEHCDRVLKVSSKKIGSKGKCPNCQAPIQVPEPEEADALMERRRKEATPEIAEEQAEEEDLSPFAEFAVYDRDDDDYYDDEDSEYYYEGRSEDERPVDHNYLAVPRWAIYGQGLLLAGIGLLCFGLGIVVGAFTPDGGKSDDDLTGPFFVTGEIRYQDSGRPQPDNDAVVIVLPVEATPGTKVRVTGLRPEDDALGLLDQLRPLLEVGGLYERANSEGNYQLKIRAPGKYLVLVISRNAIRADGEEMSMDDLAVLGKYFTDVPFLIGDRQYTLVEKNIRRDQSYPVSFFPSRL